MHSSRRSIATLLSIACIAMSPASAESTTSTSSTPLFERFAGPGPFPIGVRTLVLVDASRDDPYSRGPRTLVTEIWYPAVDESRGRPVSDFTAFFRGHDEGARAFVGHFGGKLEEVNERFVCHAVRDAPIREGCFPFLVFSHGNGGVRHQNVSQVEHLASHGYVVVSPDHTGNAGITPFDDRFLPYDRSRRSRDRSGFERPRDVRFLIDSFLGRTRDEASWLRGSIDAERIGVLGHSFGGYTACRAAEIDPRVKAILPMTVALGSAPGDTPILLMLARLDDTVKLAGNVVSSVYWNDCKGPRYLLTLKRGGHFSYSDMDLINPGFGDGIGKDEKDGETIEYLDSDTTKRVVNAYGLAFFDLYLKHEQEARKLLASNALPNELDLKFESASSLDAVGPDGPDGERPGTPAEPAEKGQ